MHFYKLEFHVTILEYLYSSLFGVVLTFEKLKTKLESLKDNISDKIKQVENFSV